MWNEKRSLLLSKIFVLAFGVALVAVLLLAPRLVRLVMFYSSSAKLDMFWLFLATIYTGGAVAGFLLYCLYRLLHNIGLDDVFCEKNVSYMRSISWCCFIGAGIAALSALYYPAWLAVAIAAAFMALVVRVVKNIIGRAVLIKEENDYTI